MTTNDIDGAPLPRIDWSSDRTLRIWFGDDISESSRAKVRQACECLHAAGLPGLCDITPAYATVQLTFQLSRDRLGPCQPEELIAIVRRVIDDRTTSTAHSPTAPVIEVPVTYGGSHGPDLDSVAELCGRSADGVVRLHSGAEYTVHFLGFMPGFAYLGGLPAALHVSRLERPRLAVPSGSVGIAGAQTGVYPQSTPGGWRLIGRTPLCMFDAARSSPSTLRPGDRVRFVAITPAEFAAMERDGRHERGAVA